MTTTGLRKKAKEQLDLLSPAKVRVAADFLMYLAGSKSVSAVAKLVKLRRFERELVKAERQVAAGLVVPAENLRRKYKPRV